MYTNQEVWNAYVQQKQGHHRQPYTSPTTIIIIIIVIIIIIIIITIINLFNVDNKIIQIMCIIKNRYLKKRRKCQAQKKAKKAAQVVLKVA